MSKVEVHKLYNAGKVCTFTLYKFVDEAYICNNGEYLSVKGLVEARDYYAALVSQGWSSEVPNLERIVVDMM